MNNPHPLRAHWFFVVAPIILAADIYLGLISQGAISRLIELGLLFDLLVLVPSLYWICYRQRGKKAIIKAVALACLGVWIALKLVPESEREVLVYAAPLRYIGLAGLVWLEIVVIVAVYRAVFNGRPTAEAAAKASTDMPPWVAKLLVLEARLWLKLWQFIKRIFGRL